jgi:hypothetical protein
MERIDDRSVCFEHGTFEPGETVADDRTACAAYIQGQAFVALNGSPRNEEITVLVRASTRHEAATVCAAVHDLAVAAVKRM